MRWAEVSLVTSPESADAVTEILLSQGCGGVASSQSHGVTLSAYLPVDDRLPAALERIKARAAELETFGLPKPDGEVTVRFVEDEDWATAWKSFFKPLVVGNIVIRPTWEAYDAQPGQVVVDIDPGMAFGTGNHPTTQMCLAALERCLHPGDEMLDVGCGSGILSIAGALLGASRVVGIDIDPIAVKAARENVISNGVGAIVVILEGDSPVAAPRPADVVTANIIATAIIGMAGDLAAYVKRSGTLIASGIIEERRAEVEAALTRHSLWPVETMVEGEWVSIIARKQ